MERRLVAILVADVVGYTRLMGQDEAGTLTQLKDFRAAVFDPAVAAHSGRLVKLMGDGALVEFASVVQAVTCAVELQRGAQEHRSELSEERRLRLRVGVNQGDVIVEGKDLYGDGINVAARLQALAEPGTVCVSAKVKDEVATKLGLGFEDLGRFELKNVTEPIHVFRVVPEPSVVHPSRRVLSLPGKPSVAILPFANMSGNPEQSYFADGFTDDIITELSRFRSLFVIARNSSFVYRGRAVDMRRVGGELGVRYVVEGSVRRAAGQVRITTQLVEAATGNQLWAERYDRNLEGIFEVQDEIVQVIVSTLADRLEVAERQKRRRRPRTNLNAYDLLHRGIGAHYKFTKEANAEARQHYLRAIEADPEMVTAHHRLAWTYLMDFELGWRGPAELLLTKALAAAQRAVDLDPAEGLAEMALSSAHLAARNFEAAVVHAQRAVKLNPNDAEIVLLHGMLDILTGNPTVGVQRVEQAMRQNPFAPVYYPWTYGIGLYSMGQYTEALDAFREINSPPTSAHAHIAATLARLDRMEEAASEMAIFIQLAATEHAPYPGDDPAAWRVYFAQSLQYRDPEMLDRWMEGFRMAGLPG